MILVKTSITSSRLSFLLFNIVESDSPSKSSIRSEGVELISDSPRDFIIFSQLRDSNILCSLLRLAIEPAFMVTGCFRIIFWFL